MLVQRLKGEFGEKDATEAAEWMVLQARSDADSPLMSVSKENLRLCKVMRKKRKFEEKEEERKRAEEEELRRKEKKEKKNRKRAKNDDGEGEEPPSPRPDGEGRSQKEFDEQDVRAVAWAGLVQ